MSKALVFTVQVLFWKFWEFSQNLTGPIHDRQFPETVYF